MRTIYLNWYVVDEVAETDHDYEVEVQFQATAGDPSTGDHGGAEDMCVVSVDGGKDVALIQAAQAWLDSNDDAQTKVHEAAREDNPDVDYLRDRRDG